MNAAQDLVAGLDDHQAIVARLDPAITRDDTGRKEVFELGDQLDAGVTATDHAHGQHPPAALPVGLMISVLGQVDQVIAQEHGIVEPLVVQRVLLDAGNAEGRRHAADRDHQPVIVDGALGEDHPPAGQVDVADGVAPEAEPSGPSDIPDRLDDVAWLDQR